MPSEIEYGAAVKSYGIVIPARNEARCIAAVVAECLSVTKSVLVIDDGSTDGTGRLARHAGARVLRNARTMGLGYTLRRGIRLVAREHIDLIVTLDGDGAHDAQYVLPLIEGHLSSRADLTIGSRFLRLSTMRSVPSAKIAANRFATSLVNLALHLNMTDVASGMRVFGPRAAGLHFNVNDYGVAVEFLVEATRKGLKIVEIPIAVRYDATRPYCTNQHELLNLLDFVGRKVAGQSKLALVVARLRRTVHRYKPAIVQMATGRYYLHPVREYHGYLFQLQPEWFARLGRVPQKEVLLLRVS